ncbi:MAG: hypothetical protein VKK07_01675 [Merismopediaceae bacterium]|nr:hypothetical protein [Merismopediaceae bacterium]
MNITLNLSDQQWQKLAFIQQYGNADVVSLLDKIIDQEYEALHTKNPDTPTPTAESEQEIAWNTWVAEVKQLSPSTNISPEASDYSKHLIEKYRKQGLIL